MSVILTACRNSRQRAIERALKKKAEKKKEKRLAKEARMKDYLCDDTSECREWTFSLNGKLFKVTFYLDTLDVECNGRELDTEIKSFEGEKGKVSEVTFWLGEDKTTIKTEVREKGLVHNLTIEGTDLMLPPTDTSPFTKASQ